MNNNLKLIANRARGSVPSGLTTDQWIDYYNQSFAELIVNECADYLYKHAEFSDKDVNQFLEHFGVRPKYHEYHQEDYDKKGLTK